MAQGKGGYGKGGGSNMTTTEKIEKYIESRRAMSPGEQWQPERFALKELSVIEQIIKEKESETHRS